MEVSESGKKFIAGFEGCQCIAYPDIESPLAKKCKQQGISIYGNGYRRLLNWNTYKGEPWTIGYGNTGGGIEAGTTWTAEQCYERFEITLETLSEMVTRYSKGIWLTQNQFDVLVSFAYNAGPGRLREVMSITKLDSTLDRKVAFANELLSYTRGHNYGRPRGDPVPGLMRRRKAEKELFLT